MIICFSYCVPENSSYQIREQLYTFGDLELKLGNVGSHVDQIYLGDFNARTGIDIDYLYSEDNTDIPIPLDLYEIDSERPLLRQNLDKIK